MIWMFILLFEIIFVFYTSRFIYRGFFSVFYKFSKSHGFSEKLLFLTFLPGVVVHELAHFLVAEILMVKTFGIDLSPKMQDGSLRMGSVRVAECDIFRRVIIGAAPMVVGILIIYALLLFFKDIFVIPPVFDPINLLILVVVAWIIFLISNTMFSSKKDMEGALGLLVVIAFAFLVAAVALVLVGQNPAYIILSLLDSAFIADIARVGVLILLPSVVLNFIFVISLGKLSR